MSRQLIGFLVVVVLSAPLVSCDWLVWKYKEDMREEFVVDLRTAVEELSDGATLDLADVTPFEWDVVHIVGPYTTAEQVENVVGAPVHDYEIPRHSEGDRLLVFSKKGRVVLEVELVRGPCDFPVVDVDGRWGRAIEIAREEARFRIERSERGTCRLVPLHVRVIHNPVKPPSPSD